jgi:ATP-binding cassette subfamily B multidrug efflux pump
MLALAFLSTVCGLLGPLFQKVFLDRLSGSSQFSFVQIRALDAFSQGSLLFLTFLSLLGALALSQAVIYLGTRESLWMQRRLSQRLYDHTLSLRTESLHRKPVGEIVSIYTVDVPGATILLEQSLPQGLGIVFPLTLAPLVLIYFLNVPASVLLPILGAVLVLNFFLAFRQSEYFFQFKRLAADRVGYVNEWIQNMRTLRILGWISAFEEKIFHVRRVETRNRISMLNNGQTMNGIASSITFVLNVVLISVLINIQKETITSGTLLALLWIVAIFMTRPFRQMPWFFTFVFDAWTSIKRVSELLLLRNREPLPRAREFQKLISLETPDPALKVRGLSLEIDGHSLLEDLNFEVKVGEFLAIVGEVGSGKSLLLFSLMGETGATFKEFWIGENDARKLPLDQLRQFFTFVPQEGFIMSATLRENVAFQYNSDKENDPLILASLSRAQFDIEKERVENGLDTDIGERGVNLSGGQKQRVSLARVDFYQSPIVLLDDCLSAVDVDTEKKLIHNLLSGPWKNRSRLLVTHRLSVLRQVDRILFLDQGRLKAEGTFAELLKNSPEFRDYTASLERHETASIQPLPLVASGDEAANASLDLIEGKDG